MSPGRSLTRSPSASSVAGGHVRTFSGISSRGAFAGLAEHSCLSCLGADPDRAASGRPTVVPALDTSFASTISALLGEICALALRLLVLKQNREEEPCTKSPSRRPRCSRRLRSRASRPISTDRVSPSGSSHSLATPSSA